MKSRLYIGSLRHRRHSPLRNHFTYPTAMAYLDLDELQEVFQGHPWWGYRRPAWARFHRGDYLNPAIPSLKDAVLQRVQELCGQRPRGAVRMLTHLRYAGHCFNPVTFYYCFDPADKQVDQVLAEITNTPWGERHCYLVERKPGTPKLQDSFAKDFHVSPFNPMNQQYRWFFSQPGRGINVHMQNHDAEGHCLFDATLSLRARPMSRREQAALLLRFPLHTLTILMRIHWQALKLWWKGAPFYVHPRKNVS